MDSPSASGSRVRPLIARLVSSLSLNRALVVGVLAGLALFAVSSFLVAMVWPEWRNSPFAVLFTHLVFGLVSAGAYRGLLRRKPVAIGDQG